MKPFVAGQIVAMRKPSRQKLSDWRAENRMHGWDELPKGCGELKRVVGLPKDHHDDNRDILLVCRGDRRAIQSDTSQLRLALSRRSNPWGSLRRSFGALNNGWKNTILFNSKSLNSLFVARLVATLGELFIIHRSGKKILVVKEASEY